MDNCRLCGSERLEPAFNFGAQPIVHHLLLSEQQHSPLFDFFYHGELSELRVPSADPVS